MNINCDIIGDLLPLYAEDMVSPASKELVDEHLVVCESCLDKLTHMRELVPIPAEEKVQEAAPLKKFRFWLLAAILGFPLWFPLLVGAAVIALVLYLCVWIVVISLWCVPVSLAAAALAAWVTGAAGILSGGMGIFLFYGGCGIVCTGLAILFFLFVKAFTVGVGKGTARLFRRIRRGKYA